MFRTKFAALLMFACIGLFAFAGCEKDTEPGGPGVKTPDPNEEKLTGEREVADASRTYELALPSGTFELEQGETDKFTIGVERGSELKDDIIVTLTASQQDLSVEPKEHTFSGEETEFEFSITAGKTANPGETAIAVVGKMASKADGDARDARDQVNGRINVEIIDGDGDSDNE